LLLPLNLGWLQHAFKALPHLFCFRISQSSDFCEYLNYYEFSEYSKFSENSEQLKNLKLEEYAALFGGSLFNVDRISKRFVPHGEMKSNFKEYF